MTKSTKKQGSSRIYENARDRLLDAAEVVLEKLGPAGLTVDAVIAQAGISKGGFFYHFATKRALMLAMGERLYIEAAQRQAANVASDPVPYGRLTRSYVRLTVQSDRKFDRRMRSYALAMIALVQEDPSLVPEVQAANAVFFQALEVDGLPPAQRRLVILATQGLWLTQALHFHKFTAEEIADVGKLLLAMTRKALS
jgi:AcrR family transcriptional regulator